MFPLRDTQPSYTRPVVTIALIAVNLLVFLFEASLGPRARNVLFEYYGLIPDQFRFTSILTSMFLHGGWMHVLGNMWFLYIFGDNVEDYLGHFKYLVFYLLAGLFAMTVQAAADPHSSVPTLGASGAIAGVLGAYFVLYPKAKVLTWFPPIFFFHLPAWVMLGYWFVVQFVAGATTALVYEGRTKGGGGIAFWAHVAGFLAGVVMIKVFPERQRRYPYAYR